MNKKDKKLDNPAPLSRSYLPDRVANEIVLYIKRENTKCGDQLPSEKQFSEFFGVGRASIREAIARLKSTGLVKSVQGLGLILNNITIDSYFQSLIGSDLGYFLHMNREETKQLIDLRLLLEQTACNNYLATGSVDDLLPMKACLDLLIEDTQRDDEVAFRIHDVDFHRALVALAKNKIMDYLYSIIRVPSIREIEMLLAHRNFQIIQRNHEEIYQSLVNKDPNVTELIKKHLEYVFNDSPDLV